MTPWGYVNMAVKRMSERKHFTISGLTKYCIKNSKELDPGDEDKIQRLMENLVEALSTYGNLSKCAGIYTVETDLSKIEIIVFDEPRKMNPISIKTIDTLNEIYDKITYLDDPSFRL